MFNTLASPHSPWPFSNCTISTTHGSLHRPPHILLGIIWVLVWCHPHTHCCPEDSLQLLRLSDDQYSCEFQLISFIDPSLFHPGLRAHSVNSPVSDGQLSVIMYHLRWASPCGPMVAIVPWYRSGPSELVYPIQRDGPGVYIVRSDVDGFGGLDDENLVSQEISPLHSQ
jgi:hypothetical protein